MSFLCGQRMTTPTSAPLRTRTSKRQEALAWLLGIATCTCSIPNRRLAWQLGYSYLRSCVMEAWHRLFPLGAGQRGVALDNGRQNTKLVTSTGPNCITLYLCSASVLSSGGDTVQYRCPRATIMKARVSRFIAFQTQSRSMYNRQVHRPAAK